MISVIIPVYNAEKWLNRCIDSVLAQTLSDWELILIDDGSTDNSPTICDQAASSDERIRVIHQENQGASLARRNGIAEAKGEYISFVDSDDQIERNYLETLYHALIGKKVRVSACNINRHHEGEEFCISSGECEFLDERQLLERFFKYEFWGFPGKLYHKSVFDDVTFPPHTINEDYMVMAQIFHFEKEIAYTSTPLYHYMLHEGSLSNTTLSRRMFDEYHNKLWVLNFYKDNNLTYVPHAKAQLAETCIKLCREVREQMQRKEFASEYQLARGFLQKNLFSLMFNRHLLLGLKAMVIRYAL